MHTKPMLLAAAIAATLALAGCDNDRNDGANADAGTMDAAAEAEAAGDEPGLLDAVTAGETLALVAAVDQHEIDMAQQARDKEVQGDVRAYADMLFDDHSANLEKGRAVADDAGIEPASTAMVGAQQTKGATVMERLSELEGEDYSRAFVDAMVKGHADALAMLDERMASTDLDDTPALREHVAATREAIARHLEHGKSLQEKGLGAGDANDTPPSMASDGSG